MATQTQSALATSSIASEELHVSAPDRAVLRALAQRVAELAARPLEAEKRERWRRHNDLQPERPMIFCDPENGWNEIVTEDQLRCAGTLARTWEMTLRKEIFWGESMSDDRVVEALFDVPHAYIESDWGMHETKIGGEHGGSYRWDAPLQSYDDFDKLHFPIITVDHAASAAVVQLAHNTLGDLLTVRLKTRWWWTLGMTWVLAKLRGLEQIMFDMYDEPDNLKRLMALLRDGHLAKLDFLEAHGLLAFNGDGTYVGSGGFGYTRQLPAADFRPDHVRPRDMWGFCESQETTTVSPEMFAEFIYPYQVPILERFGLNCYGCCEPLDQRWLFIKDTPRLRRVSVSTWANPDAMAELLGHRFIFSSKPNPAHLAVPQWHADAARAEVRRVIAAARRQGCPLELIMKDNHTLGGNPQNAVNWCRMARAEIERAWKE